MSASVDEIAKGLYSQFSKKELHEVASELEISIDGSETTRVLARKILGDINENGVPENLEEISDTLFELLVAAEFIDEDGNIIEEAPSGEETATAIIPADEIPDWKCFSYADPRDPACNKCKLYEPCWKRRVEIRPSCFGKFYAENDPECGS